MKRQTLIWLAFITFFAVSSSESVARIGGGRSFGSRGSRGLAPRPMPSQPYARPQNIPPRDAGMQPGMAPRMERPSFFSGGFGRALVGGIAGGFLGSLLFRGMGFAGGGGGFGGGGGLGFIEILLIGALIFFLVRWFRNSRSTPAYAGNVSSLPENNSTTYAAPVASSESTEGDAENELRRYNSGFSLRQFKEKRTDDFFRIQAAFMARDLTPIRLLLTPEMHDAVEKDLAELRAARKINRLESMAVRETTLSEAWQEYGKEFATIHFTASLLDYTVDEVSGQVVNGSRTEPVKFDEFWTFVRDVNGSTDEWRLCAIGNA